MKKEKKKSIDFTVLSTEALKKVTGGTLSNQASVLAMMEPARDVAASSK